MKKRDHIPDVLLERLSLDELSDQERQEIETEMGTDPLIAKRLAQIEKSNDEILSAYPAEEITENILKRIAQEEHDSEPNKVKILPFPASRLIVPIAAAAVLAFAIGVLPSLSREAVVTEPQISMERVKGLNPSLAIFREEGNSAESLPAGSIAWENDRIQIKYNAAGKRYGVIFSIDGRGAISLHFPDFVGASNLLDTSGSVALPFSYQLDDAPDFERFFFVSSDESFTVSEILEKAQDLTADMKQSKKNNLPLPKDFGQVSVLINKEQSK